MELDPLQCYKAIQSRDARFDGRFFTAVLTTGIYCRPVCPAITPRPENVVFYPSAAAAREAGFRPCQRCHPEVSPGTPLWRGSQPIVDRGLRLIEQGLLDEAGVDGLADSLNIGARHLRRLFVRELGAPPLALAQTRRLDFARRLIDETSLSLTQIAFAAGFASLRRFNDAFLRAYGRPPRAFRRSEPAAGTLANHNNLSLRLFYRPPFNWEALSRFMGARLIPGVEAAGDGFYRRTVRLRSTAGVIEARPDPTGRYVLLQVPAGFAQDLLGITERVRDLFDLRSDPLLIGEHLGQDPFLQPLVEAVPGMRVPGAWDGFEIAVRAILGQQVSVKAATTMAGRLVQEFGDRLPGGGDGQLTHLFPTAGQLAQADLHKIGLTRPRAFSIRQLAVALEEGQLSFRTGASLQATLEQLTALPGIGMWTAQYIAMRALREPDAFPAGDLGLRKALSPDGRSSVSELELAARAESWRPWRAYAAMYLWNRLSTL